jgi:hypothetical protein
MSFATRRWLDGEEIEHRGADVLSAHQPVYLTGSESDATPEEETIGPMVTRAISRERLTYMTDARRRERGDRRAVIPFHEQIGHVAQTRTLVQFFHSSDPSDSGVSGVTILKLYQRITDFFAQPLVLRAGLY